MSPRNKYLVPILVFAPVFIWLFTIGKFAVNVPWFDDFDPFADFIRKWVEAPGFQEKLGFLFQPNNEHRMVPAKLLTLLYFLVTGEVNFVFLQICGALFTIGSCWLIYSMFRRLGLPLLYFLPVPFLLFQFQFHLVFLWSICSLQHQPSVFFMCLCMYLLAKRKLSWAVIAALLGNFSFGNGMFIWPAGAVVLLLRHDWKSLLIWVIAGCAGIFFYLNGMSAQGNDSGIGYFFKYPYMPIVGLWAFLGGLFDLFSKHNPIGVRTALPILAGMLMTGFVAIWFSGMIFPFLRRYVKWPVKIPALPAYLQNRLESNREFSGFVAGLLAFSLVNGIIVGFLRPRFGFDVLVVSNYKLYPALFMVSAYLALLIVIAPSPNLKKIFTPIAVLSIAIWGISLFYQLPDIAERRKYLLVNAYNQEHNAFGLGFKRGSEAANYTDSLVKYLLREGIYDFPATNDPYYTLMKSTVSPLAAETLHLRQELRDRSVYLFRDNIPYRVSYRDATYAFIRNEKEMLVFKFDQSPYRGKNIFRQFEKASHVEIPFEILEPGQYDLGILNVEGGNIRCGLIGKTEVKPPF